MALSTWGLIRERENEEERLRKNMYSGAVLAPKSSMVPLERENIFLNTTTINKLININTN